MQIKYLFYGLITIFGFTSLIMEQTPKRAYPDGALPQYDNDEKYMSIHE